MATIYRFIVEGVGQAQATTILANHDVDENGVFWYAIELREAYPVNIQPTTLTYNENDSYMKLVVHFAYRDFITYDQKISQIFN
jgi:hypothetical protein